MAVSGSSCLVTVRGIPNIPTIVDVNVRSGPSTKQALLFKSPVGTSGLTVLDVQPDAENNSLNGKMYQWFRLTFPDGRMGWIRDDLIEIEGDCGQFGYGAVSPRRPAFELSRGVAPAQQASSSSVGAAAQPTQPPAAVMAIDDMNRVRRAAFAVTAAFEGKGYNAYQNYDRGIVSYGRFQFALTGGLGSVIQKYITRSQSQTARDLAGYMPRVQAVDESLRGDTRFRDLLLAAANEKAMQDAQDEAATENYWNRVLDVSLRPRGIVSPLGTAMLFDTGIQYGIMHQLIGLAEDELKVPRKSKLGENGITEQQLIAQVADRRKRGLYAQAERDNLPGLRTRADFWVTLVAGGDWGFQGDANGTVNVNGKIIQVRNP